MFMKTTGSGWAASWRKNRVAAAKQTSGKRPSLCGHHMAGLPASCLPPFSKPTKHSCAITNLTKFTQTLKKKIEKNGLSSDLLGSQQLSISFRLFFFIQKFENLQCFPLHQLTINTCLICNFIRFVDMKKQKRTNDLISYLILQKD